AFNAACDGAMGFLRCFSSSGMVQLGFWNAANPIERQIKPSVQARRNLRMVRLRGEGLVIDTQKFSHTRGVAGSAQRCGKRFQEKATCGRSAGPAQSRINPSGVGWCGTLERKLREKCHGRTKDAAAGTGSNQG